ncbi:MAG TPA: cyclic nucleotide-binding domain-containing protein [Thermoanaerobaculia bacterium]|nr:cyclic nucleotide-binding domain-containing protein [Thermoanaerobaculia bacterium]
MLTTPVITETLAPFEKNEAVARGQVLFREGEEPRGLYFVHSGQLDLLYASRTGDTKTLRTAEAGQILGLSCIVSRRAHDCTATAKTPVTIGFIEQATFRRLLEEKPALWFNILQLISADVNACWDCMRSLAGVAR